MTAGQQTLLLFLGIGCVLAVASAVGYVLARRAGDIPNSVVNNLNQRIKAWWVMVALIGVAFIFGRIGVILLFAAASFTALREFITLTETRRGDHHALVAAFFLVVPIQYILVAFDWYGLYSIFIPVYVFLLMPILAAIRADTTRFMERVAVTQWALMLAVFCLSHVPALLTLQIPGYEGRGLLLIAFLVLVVQSSDVLQYVFGKLYGRRKIAPDALAVEDLGGFRRRRRRRHPHRRRALVDHAIQPVSGAAHGARHRLDGLPGRAGHVGHQARPRRQGLGPHDRRTRRRPRPPRLGGLRRPRVLPPHALFLVGLKIAPEEASSVERCRIPAPPRSAVISITPAQA